MSVSNQGKCSECGAACESRAARCLTCHRTNQKLRKAARPCSRCGAKRQKGSSYCQPCRRQWYAEWSSRPDVREQQRQAGRDRRNPAKRAEIDRRSRLRRIYGITPDEYEEMLTAQEGLCAICRRPPTRQRLRVDHDHETGRVRGLLCDQCNTGLGMFRDNPENFRIAIEYLVDAAPGR